jgi:hypothetical protein
MINGRIALILAAWMTAGILPGSAGEAPKAPPKEKKAIVAEVVAVKGNVTARRPGQKEFAPVKAGMRLPEKAEISTGLNSTCRLKLPNVVLMVEALTTTAIDRLRLGEEGPEEAKGGTIDTKVNLHFGTVKFKVRKGALKTDLKIATPNSTTAISGTEGGKSSYADQPDLSGTTNGETEMECESGGFPVPDGELMDSDGMTRLMRLRVWIFGRIYWIIGGTDAERDGGLSTGGGGAFMPPADALFGNGRSPFLEERRSFESQARDLPSPPPPPLP